MSVEAPASRRAGAPDDPRHDLTLVGVGAGPRGGSAFARLLENLSDDCPLSFAFVHSSDGADAVRLLRRATTLRVIEVSVSEAIEPATVYVAPPGATLVIGEHRIQCERGHPREHARVDQMFLSLAEQRGARALAVL
ncbi:MAG: chemotaxis protein CheB, partial [Gammaproteobacteria bacterium]|nr:chemotaxis protein CheB [Gammaproteobacteria bacterium]